MSFWRSFCPETPLSISIKFGTSDYVDDPASQVSALSSILSINVVELKFIGDRSGILRTIITP